MLIAAALAAVLSSSAHADEAAPDVTALMLARICVNEEGWDSPDGCRAIWDVVQNVRSRRCDPTCVRAGEVPVTECSLGGRTFAVRDRAVPGAEETHLSAMRRLSRGTTGHTAPRNARQSWTSTLQDSSDPPAGWRECGALPAESGCHGSWRRYASAWERARALAKDLVAQRGRGHWRGAGARPRVIAWGGEMDHWLAERRGLVEVDCGKTENRFYVPGPSVQELRKSGRPDLRY